MNSHGIEQARNGSVLVIVAGLSMLLLTMFLVVVRQVRSEVNDGTLILREAQARTMLPAALCYILERARLGVDNGTVEGTEGWGWTDLRDGGIGPRGPRSPGGAIPALAPDAEQSLGGNSWPLPGSILRAPMYTYQTPPCAVKPIYAYNPMKAPDAWLTEWENAVEADLPQTRLGRIFWPVSGDNRNWGELNAGNWASYKDHTGATGTWQMVVDGTAYPVPDTSGRYALWAQVYEELFKPGGLENMGPEYHFALTPQPEEDTFAAFVAGDRGADGRLRVRLDSYNRGWFRIYRETLADHDGDGSPYYDTFGLGNNYSVFVITCGSGGTDGFRTWAEASACPGIDAVKRFGSQARFEDLRSQERIFWFRVEWSANVGGGVDYTPYAGHRVPKSGRDSQWAFFIGLGGKGDDQQLLNYEGSPAQTTPRMAYANLLLQRRTMNEKLGGMYMMEYGQRTTAQSDDDAATSEWFQQNPNPLFNNFGTIRWIDRLEREPPTW